MLVIKLGRKKKMFSIWKQLIMLTTDINFRKEIVNCNDRRVNWRMIKSNN